MLALAPSNGVANTDNTTTNGSKTTQDDLDSDANYNCGSSFSSSDGDEVPTTNTTTPPPLLHLSGYPNATYVLLTPSRALAHLLTYNHPSSHPHTRIKRSAAPPRKPSIPTVSILSSSNSVYSAPHYRNELILFVVSLGTCALYTLTLCCLAGRRAIYQPHTKEGLTHWKVRREIEGELKIKAREMAYLRKELERCDAQSGEGKGKEREDE